MDGRDMWHKRNSYPGKWPNRFRDGWERCLHFTKQKNFAMYQDEVRVPMGDWKNARLRNLSETDRRRDNSRVQSGFGKKIENWVGRELAYPDNVLQLATECNNRGHSATLPVELPTWFIKLFTQSGDIILDPFIGSGTTAVAAKQLDRGCIGIELDQLCTDCSKSSPSCRSTHISGEHCGIPGSSGGREQKSSGDEHEEISIATPTF